VYVLGSAMLQKTRKKKKPDIKSLPPSVKGKQNNEKGVKQEQGRYCASTKEK